MNKIEKQKMGMQQNNHSNKEVSETINQTPKSHNQKKNTKHTTQSHISKPRNQKRIKSTWKSDAGSPIQRVRTSSMLVGWFSLV